MAIGQRGESLEVSGRNLGTASARSPIAQRDAGRSWVRR